MKQAPNFIIRRALPTDAEAMAKVQIEVWRSAYREILPRETLDNLSIEETSAYWREQLLSEKPRETSFIARAPGGEMAGFTACGPACDGNLGFTGELSALFILEEAQNHGTGRRLVCAAARALAAEWISDLLVWGLLGCSCRSFYQALGASWIIDKEDTLDGVPVRMSAFGWRDLNPLLGLPARAQTVKAYQASNPTPISVGAGAALSLGRRDSESPGWIWCVAPSGQGSWVPERWLEIRDEKGILRRDYNAAEFTLSVGDELTLHEYESGWYWAQNREQNWGWAPSACVAFTDPV